MTLGKLAENAEQVLHDQVITADQPGTVVRDFEMLLDALGPDGVIAGGKYNLLPQKLVLELDQRLSRPLKLKLKRPQLRSHPYLQALHLLLRASGMGCVTGVGEKARLGVEPSMKMQWDQLNPTERYFNLLEAAFRYGSGEMVGEPSTRADEPLFSYLSARKHLQEWEAQYVPRDVEGILLSGIIHTVYVLALLDLFGLIKLDRPIAQAGTWYPAGIKHVPFGDGVMTLLYEEVVRKALEPAIDPSSPDDDDEQYEEFGPLEAPQFGAWQPIFQPYFPEWRQNLEFPLPERREGMFVFKVGLGKIWRRIAIHSGATLDDLATWIRKSVRFDDDHLYQFQYRTRLGATCVVMHPDAGDRPWSIDIKIGDLPLDPGQSLEFNYDFGDTWTFTAQLERIEPIAKPRRPHILERHGNSPEPYPDAEW